jgi:hypothetical protein
MVAASRRYWTTPTPYVDFGVPTRGVRHSVDGLRQEEITRRTCEADEEQVVREVAPQVTP